MHRGCSLRNDTVQPRIRVNPGLETPRSFDRVITHPSDRRSGKDARRIAARSEEINWARKRPVARACCRPCYREGKQVCNTTEGRFFHRRLGESGLGASFLSCCIGQRSVTLRIIDLSAIEFIFRRDACSRYRVIWSGTKLFASFLFFSFCKGGWGSWHGICKRDSSMASMKKWVGYIFAVSELFVYQPLRFVAFVGEIYEGKMYSIYGVGGTEVYAYFRHFTYDRDFHELSFPASGITPYLSGRIESDLIALTVHRAIGKWQWSNSSVTLFINILFSQLFPETNQASIAVPRIAGSEFSKISWTKIAVCGLLLPRNSNLLLRNCSRNRCNTPLIPLLWSVDFFCTRASISCFIISVVEVEGLGSSSIDVPPFVNLL